MRADGRQADEMRPVRIAPHYIRHAEGSALIELGATVVLCVATVEEKVPPFLKGQGRGWVTAEYAMLPRATQARNQRESVKGRPGGRTMEIQRMIGRALRSVVSLEALGERTVILDCDVLQADGGTRTASLTGAYVALALALDRLVGEGKLESHPLTDFLAAASVGIVGGRAVLDLNYEEDMRAEVDMNVAMTGRGLLVEIQGTGEASPFSRTTLDDLLRLAENGVRKLIEAQKRALGGLADKIGEEAAHGTFGQLAGGRDEK